LSRGLESITADPIGEQKQSSCAVPPGGALFLHFCKLRLCVNSLRPKAVEATETMLVPAAKAE
jgi:hypothetical protein